MTGKNVVTKINGGVEVNNVLISVSDKTGLDKFVLQLIKINSALSILSTGGTYGFIKDVLIKNNINLIDARLWQVSKYTDQPETQGGLVKTLDFKIYLGLLTETYNDAHRADLRRVNAFPIDMVVCNLYPFSKTIAQPNVTPEMARGNIDIGGPCMLRASAKNYLRVASVVDPTDYSTITEELESNKGMTTLETRFRLAKKSFAHTADYDRAIADYLSGQNFTDVSSCYNYQQKG